MTNDQMTARRIAIAEACGWHYRYRNTERHAFSFTLPDYLNDLNAMHEAEKVLSPEQAQKYFRYIREGVGPPREGEDITIANFYIHASAKIRSDAFIRVLKA